MGSIMSIIISVGIMFAYNYYAQSTLPPPQYMLPPQYMQVTCNTNSTATQGTIFAYTDVLTPPMSVITMVLRGVFALQPGFTYKCSAQFPIANTQLSYYWVENEGGEMFGNAGITGPTFNAPAVGFIVPTATTTMVSLKIAQGNCTMAGRENDSLRRGPSATIEVCR